VGRQRYTVFRLKASSVDSVDIRVEWVALHPSRAYLLLAEQFT
jgi:hypothetical protein